MRKKLMMLMCLVGIGIVAWLTGVLAFGYQYSVLSIAFLANYLTPQNDIVTPIGQTWSRW
jgi:hypothetical protein